MMTRSHPADHPVLANLESLGYTVTPETTGGELYGYKLERPTVGDPAAGGRYGQQFDYRFQEGQTAEQLLDLIWSERQND